MKTDHQGLAEMSAGGQEETKGKERHQEE
jgi:hypothetical protein